MKNKFTLIISYMFLIIIVLTCTFGNKVMALNNISENGLKSAVPLAKSHTIHHINLNDVLNEYWSTIFVVTLIVVIIMILGIIALIRINKNIKIMNKWLLSLSDISDEYIYKYDVKHHQIQLLDRCAELFTNVKEFQNDLTQINKKVIDVRDTSSPQDIIDILISNDKTSEIILYVNNKKTTFRVIKSIITGRNGYSQFIVGKLININFEKELICKAQTDQMTGLLNAENCKFYIKQKLESYNLNKSALLIIDIDNFKNINDNSGHLIGDKAITFIANSLKNTFKNNSIIGRVGGDEFCVFIDEEVDKKVIEEKVKSLKRKIKNNDKDLGNIGLTLSVGAVILNKNEIFDVAYKKADEALYKVKSHGKNGLNINLNIDK